MTKQAIQFPMNCLAWVESQDPTEEWTGSPWLAGCGRVGEMGSEGRERWGRVILLQQTEPMLPKVLPSCLGVSAAGEAAVSPPPLWLLPTTQEVRST